MVPCLAVGLSMLLESYTQSAEPLLPDFKFQFPLGTLWSLAASSLSVEEVKEIFGLKKDPRDDIWNASATRAL